MNYYLRALGIFLAIYVPSMVAMYKLTIYDSVFDLVIIASAVFLSLSFIMHMFLSAVIKSSNRGLFISLTMLSSLTNLVVSVGLVVWYRYQHPGLKINFVIPFIIVYLFFTIFDTITKNHLANQKP
jgi:hypothetical protein